MNIVEHIESSKIATIRRLADKVRSLKAQVKQLKAARPTVLAIGWMERSDLQTHPDELYIWRKLDGVLHSSSVIPIAIIAAPAAKKGVKP